MTLWVDGLYTYECQFWQKDTGHFFYLINFLSVSVQVYLVTLLDTDTKQALFLAHSLRQIIDKQARAIYEQDRNKILQRLFSQVYSVDKRKKESILSNKKCIHL